MKINFHFNDPAAIVSACATLTGKDREDIVRMLDGKTIEMDVFPRKGDNVCFVLGPYDLKLDIDYSYINYVDPEVGRINEEYRGVHYDVYVGTVYVDDVCPDVDLKKERA